MSAIILVGLIISVLVLCSRLHETKTQLRQARHERDVYQHIYEDFISADFYAAMPRNYREVPERKES